MIFELSTKTKQITFSYRICLLEALPKRRTGYRSISQRRRPRLGLQSVQSLVRIFDSIYYYIRLVYPVSLFSNLSVGPVFPGVNRNGSLTLSLIFRNWQSIIFSGYYDPLLSRNRTNNIVQQCLTIQNIQRY